ILNRSRATVANVYLAMYPTPYLAQAMKDDGSLIENIWRALNRVAPEVLLGEGRVYGGGLHKLEPKELCNVRSPEIANFVSKASRPAVQSDLFSPLAAE